MQSSKRWDTPGARALGLFIGLSILLCIIYSRGLPERFLGIDDSSLVSIPQLHLPFGAKLIKTLFTVGNHIDYYPIRDFSYWVDVNVLGVDSRGSSGEIFRVENILFFSGASALLFLILQTLNLGIWCLPLTLLWALNPVHAELMMWVSARKDVLAIFFFFLSTLFFLRSQFVFSLGAFALSLLSKTTFSLMPVAAVVALLAGRRNRNALRTALIAAIMGLAFSAFQKWFYSNVNDVRMHFDTWHRIAVSVTALGRMVSGWFWAAFNGIDINNWGQWLKLNSAFLWVGIVLWTVAFLGAVWGILTKNVYFLVGLFATAAAYIPISGLFFDTKNFYSVRYIEAPAIVFFVFASVSIFKLGAHDRVRRTHALGLAVLVMLVMASAAMTAFESGNWSSNAMIAQTALRVTPQNESLQNVMLHELQRIHRISSLAPPLEAERETLAIDLKRECTLSRISASRGGDLCWPYWGMLPILRGTLGRSILHRADIEAAIAGVFPDSYRKLESRFEFRETLLSDRVEGAQAAAAEWLKNNPYSATEEMRALKLIATCFSKGADQARRSLNVLVDDGLLEKTYLPRYIDITLGSSSKVKRSLDQCFMTPAQGRPI